MTEWTEEDIDTLLKMHKRKHRQSEIADKLGKTRNAIAGKLHHLGLSGVRIVKKPVEYVNEETVFTRDLKDAERNECRYMEAVPMICGKAIYKRDMCQDHYDLCYIMPKSRKETDAAIKERIATAERNDRSVF